MHQIPPRGVKPIPVTQPASPRIVLPYQTAGSGQRIFCPAPVLTLPRMNWFARHKKLKIAAILALLMTAGILCVFLQPDELSRYKARLAASGEELSLVKLSPSYSQEAVEYQQQLAHAAARLIFTPVHPSEIALMAKTTNGLARAAWTRPTPAKPVRGTWEDFANQMDGSEAALSDLRALLAAPVPGSAYNSSAPLAFKVRFDLVARRKTAQTLAAAVVHELHRGRLDAALTNLNALIDLARFSEEGEMLLGRMIQIAIAGLAISATWESLQAPGWTEVQLAGLQSEWQRLEMAPGFARIVEKERAFAVGHYELCRTNATERRKMYSYGGGGGNKVTEMLYEDLYLPIWATAWSKGDELKYLETMQPIIDGVRRAATNGSYHAMRAALTEATRSTRSRRTILDKARFPMASIGLSNWEKAATSLLRYETQRQMVLAAIALKRFELKQGRLPADLASLVPEFLPSMPVDYMNGRHLQYRRLSDQRFRLWSVGNDERDENGNGDDLVWFELDRGSPDGAVSEN